jgi:hypothetical protein
MTVSGFLILIRADDCVFPIIIPSVLCSSLFGNKNPVFDDPIPLYAIPQILFPLRIRVYPIIII